MKDGTHPLNAQDVASFENQNPSSDEGPSPEKTSSAFETQETSEDKTSAQAEAHQGSEQHAKQTTMANTKTIKHQSEAESVVKQAEESPKKTSVESSPKHNPSAKKKKKIAGASDEGMQDYAIFLRCTCK